MRGLARIPGPAALRVVRLMVKGARLVRQDGKWAARLYLPESAGPLPLNPKRLWSRTFVDLNYCELIEPAGRKELGSQTFKLTDYGRRCAARS